MKLVLIFGPQAVGKMTVGEELCKITDLKLFHNHMTIDLVLNFFDYGTAEGKYLVNKFRFDIFEAVAKSDLYGLVFTYAWAFDQQEDHDYVERICKIFREQNAEIYLIELQADLNERLARNRHPHRLDKKPSKRNLEWSDNDLLKSMEIYRLNSIDGEITEKNYIKIDNTSLSAEETALLIKNTFNI